MTTAVQTMVDAIATNFEEFKHKNNERLDALEKNGHEPAHLVQAVEKLNESMDSAQKTIEELTQANKALQAQAARKEATIEIGKGKKVHVDPEAKKAQDAYLRKGANEEEFAALTRKALGVQSNPDGGFWATPDMSGRVIEGTYVTSPIRALASVQTISGFSLEGTYDQGEAEVGWTGETDPRPSTGTPQIGAWSIPAHEIYAKPKATQKFLEDASVDVESWLVGKVRDKFTRESNFQYFNGDANGKPEGILTLADSNAGYKDIPANDQIRTVLSGDAATFTSDAIIDMLYGLKAQFAANAAWGCARPSVGEIRKLRYTGGNEEYIWQPSYQAGTPATLLGIPQYDMDDMPLVANGALSLVLADWRESVQIVDRLGMAVLRDPFSAKPYVEFYCRMRTGSKVVNTDAMIRMKIGV